MELSLCQTWAAFDGHSFVIPEYIQDLSPYVWSHRIMVGFDQDTASCRQAKDFLRSVSVPL